MSDARERIAETVKEAYDWGLSDATYNTNRAADRIIGIVREALLSEAEAGQRIAWEQYTDYTWDELPAAERERELLGFKRGLECTWQAAFGADDDGGES